MSNCGQACPYNTLEGCKAKEYNKICPLTNTAVPITEYRPTNADRIRAMSDEELAEVIAIITKDDVCLSQSASCDSCRFNDFCTNCTVGRELEWLQQPAEGDLV